MFRIIITNKEVKGYTKEAEKVRYGKIDGKKAIWFSFGQKCRDVVAIEWHELSAWAEATPQEARRFA